MVIDPLMCVNATIRLKSLFISAFDERDKARIMIKLQTKNRQRMDTFRILAPRAIIDYSGILKLLLPNNLELNEPPSSIPSSLGAVNPRYNRLG